MKLCDIDFLDLYLGRDPDGRQYADIKGLSSASPGLTPADPNLDEEIQDVRAICERLHAESSRREFSFMRDDVLYRVSTFETAQADIVFTLRQKKRWERPLDGLGLSLAAQQTLLRPDLVGSVLVVGSMSSGKTTTVSTAIQARLEQFGGVALVLEDPIETRLTGKFGQGRALQIEVGENGYREELQQGMRSNASLFMIGEIRSSRTAFDFLLGGHMGHLLFSTTHGTSIEHGLTRLSSMTGIGHAEIAGLMSEGLSMIIHQSIVQAKRADGKGYDSRMHSQCLVIAGAPNETAIRSKIREGNFAQLADEIKAQQAQATRRFS